jgi:hypothetical protein
MSETEYGSDDSLRLEAIARLKKQREFHKHVAVYFLVNASLVTIWFVTNAGGFFWPVFPIVFWGIGVVMNAWDAYTGDALSERRIEQEIHRLEHRR